MTIAWNDRVRLVLADVDSTIADVYTDAEEGMIFQLERLLGQGIVLFLVSGGGKQSIYERVVGQLSSNLRQNVIVAHCSGAEVVGYDAEGSESSPYYSAYNEIMKDGQKQQWREMMKEILGMFNFETHGTMNPAKFAAFSKGNPLAIMYDDRGPQITLEMVNSEAMRQIVKEKAEVLIRKYALPIEVDLAGTVAVDFHLKGISKTVAIKHVLNDADLVRKYGIEDAIANQEGRIEIWGDKFASEGSDFKMCLAVDPGVRAISFRDEESKEFKKGFNIQLWDGNDRLEKGLLEYLIGGPEGN